jgi:hypothetical protein
MLHNLVHHTFESVTCSIHIRVFSVNYYNNNKNVKVLLDIFAGHIWLGNTILSIRVHFDNNRTNHMNNNAKYVMFKTCNVISIHLNSNNRLGEKI